MQTFTQEQHQNFKKYFNIKATPSEIDRAFLEKTKKYIWYIKWIPGIQMIGVGNSIAMNAGEKESDIDLYIVTWEKRMWLVRILITLILSILWVRKTDKHHAGRFCLSFFSTLEWMNFSKFALEDDIYLYFWIVYFQPILDFDNTYEKFIEWQIWANFDVYQEKINNNKKNISYTGTSFWKTCKIFDRVDILCKNIFLPKTLHHYEKIGKPYGIIIDDHLLKFHNNDIRNQLKKELL